MSVENVSLLHGTLLWMAGGSNENGSEKMKERVAEVGPQGLKTL